MYEIPTKIILDGKEFQIRNSGDYRMVLDCFNALQDAELSKQERLFASLLIFYQDINSLDDLIKFPDISEAVLKMYEFFNCGQTQSVGKNINYKLIDWEQDSQLICSAINKVANKEVRAEPYIHWWTFMGYYSAIGESLFSTIIKIRDKTVRGKKLEKYEREFKRDNPEYFVWNARTVEDKEADALVKELWNSGDDNHANE